MNRNVIVVFILTAALWTASAHAGQPNFNYPLPGGTLREMDLLLLHVQAVDPENHALQYEWSILSDETGGKAQLLSASHSSAEFGVYWISKASAGQLNGKKVQLQVVARHADPATHGPEQAVTTATYTIQGVNLPPVPVISGKLGTPTERIPTGYGVCADGYQSSDPEDDTVRGNWELGSKSGGKWKTPYGDIAPALIGSEGGKCCFTVIDMTAPIDQEIKLTLNNGLHTVSTSAICYLKPAGVAPPPTNSAPTISILTNPVQVGVGSQAQLVAEVTDLDGDALSYSFVFLQNGSTVASSAVSVVTVSSTKKRVTATVPAGAAGTFYYRFTARESNTTDRKSAVADFTLIVGGGDSGNGGPGDLTDTPDTCDTSTTGGPPSITITPDPSATKPLFRSGNLASISVVSSDPSERPSPLMPGKYERGVVVSWNLSELTALGAQPSVSTVIRTSDPKTADSVLTFTVPPLSVARTVYLTVTSKDVFDCGRSIRFAIRLEPGSSTGNQPPVAKIQYKVGSLSNFENAPSTPVTIQTDNAKTITLKGDTSTDDGGASNLTYSWVKVGDPTSGGVSLSPNTGATTTLQVLAHTSGVIKVTLTAKDLGNLTGAAEITFNIADPAQKPTAKATAKVGGQALTGPVAEGTVVTLDGSQSTRADGTKTNLTYQWTQSAGPNVTITDANKAVAQFTAPAGSEAGTQLTFKLIVLDGGTPSDPVELTVNLSVGSFYFSQVAVGPLGTSEFRTVLVLVNQNTAAATGVEVKFYGQDGSPMQVIINDAPWDGQPFNIPALSSKRLVFTGQDLQSGWAEVKSSLKIAGLLHYQVVADVGTVETEVGLYATEAATKFATFYDPEAETGIAVANTSSQPATVYIKLMDDATQQKVVDKLLFIGEAGGVLAGKHHKAKFLTPEFLGEMPPGFHGTLLIESDVPVSITVLKTRGGVVFSTLPVASMK